MKTVPAASSAAQASTTLPARKQESMSQGWATNVKKTHSKPSRLHQDQRIAAGQQPYILIPPEHREDDSSMTPNLPSTKGLREEPIQTSCRKLSPLPTTSGMPRSAKQLNRSSRLGYDGNLRQHFSGATGRPAGGSLFMHDGRPASGRKGASRIRLTPSGCTCSSVGSRSR